MSEAVPAKDLHPDVLKAAQEIGKLTERLIAAVETLDANKWLDLANKLEDANRILQAMLVEAPEESSDAPKRSSSKTS